MPWRQALSHKAHDLIESTSQSTLRQVHVLATFQEHGPQQEHEITFDHTATATATATGVRRVCSSSAMRLLCGARLR